MTNRKSYMAYQMAQTPETLNMTLKVTLAIRHFLTYFLENKTHSKFDICVLELESIHVAYDIEWPWRWFISFRAFEMLVVYIRAALYKISTGRPASRGPSATAGLLAVLDYHWHLFHFAVWFMLSYNSIFIWNWRAHQQISAQLPPPHPKKLCHAVEFVLARCAQCSNYRQ